MQPQVQTAAAQQTALRPATKEIRTAALALTRRGPQPKTTETTR